MVPQGKGVGYGPGWKTVGEAEKKGRQVLFPPAQGKSLVWVLRFFRRLHLQGIKFGQNDGLHGIFGGVCLPGTWVPPEPILVPN